jgi:hypothetical protein
LSKFLNADSKYRIPPWISFVERLEKEEEEEEEEEEEKKKKRKKERRIIGE